MPSQDPLLPDRPDRSPTDGGDGLAATGERIAGRYRILRTIGCGGMGRVSLAVDRATGAECALKRLDPDVLRASPEALHREFEALARVRHPAVVAVHELGFTPDGVPFFTMEYVPGLPADRVLEPRDWPALTRFAVRVAEGLEALHGAGLVHGDLKPPNLLVVPGDAPRAAFRDVRIVDFGFAGVLGAEHGRRRGTPGYAAPELLAGAAPGVATDLYALGAVLAALALRAPGARGGSPPVRGADGLATRLAEAGAPHGLALAIVRLLAPAPIDRPAHARELREELVRLDPSAARPLADRLATEVVAGRDRELALLERLVAGHGDEALAIVTGDAGAGKTALLRAFAARASLNGRAVHLVSCAASDAAGGVAAALARRLGVDVPAAGADDEAGVAAAAAALVRALTGATLVLIDDWDRCDARSRATVRRAALDPAARASRWVWACRVAHDDDRMLLASGRARALELGPLGGAALERLVDARLTRSAPAGLVATLERRTGGNPGLAIALLREAAAHGVLHEGDAGLAVDVAALESLAIAGGFEPSLLAAWSALPEASRAAVALLAVVARPVGADEARPVAGALAPAAVAGLVERTGDGAWRMVSPGLADAVVQRLDAAARRDAHRAALELPGLPPARRFAHLAGAGRVDDALAWADGAAADDPRIVVEAAALATAAAHADAPRWELRAGHAELARERHAAAVAHFERAGLPADAGARVARAVALSRAYHRVGRAADVRGVVADALAGPATPADRTLLLMNDAAALFALNDRAAALERAREAVDEAHAHGGDDDVGGAALTYGTLLNAAGRRDEAATFADEAVAAYERAGNAPGTIRATNVVAQVARARGDREAAHRTYASAVAAARRAGLRVALEELCLNHGALLVEVGRWDAGYAAFEEAARIALEDGRRRHAIFALSNMAQLDGLTGRPARARREARAALRLARGHEPAFEPNAWRALSQSLRIAGRLRAAMRSARRSLARAVRLGNAYDVTWARIEYGRVCVACGSWREAEPVWALSLARPADDPADIGRVLLVTLAGRAALRRGADDVARERLREARAAITRDGGDRPYARAHVLQLAAECAIANLDDAPVGAAVREALAAYEAMPAPADAAMAALEFARLASRHDARLPAQELLVEAASKFERLGDRRGRERALALAVDAVARQHRDGAHRGGGRDLLVAVNRILNSSSDVRELVTRAMRELVDRLDAERGVLLLDDGTRRMVPVVEHGAVDAEMRDAAVRYSRGAVERVQEIEGPVIWHDASSDPHGGFASVLDLGLRSILCVPMFSRGRVMGAVYLDSQRARVFDEEDRGLLEGFASLMVNTIERSRGQEDLTRTKERLEAENVKLRRRVGERLPDNCVAISPQMQAVLAKVELASQQDSRVLLTGENGTGKEMIAYLLHHQGKRRNGPFVTVNCGAFTDTLLQSELFGIVGGFASTVVAHEGKLEQAHRGTLFLDEVGEMPPQQQVALLSALSPRSSRIQFTRVGGKTPVKVDVRVIAATNRDLARAVQQGGFRQDLFYRLGVVVIEVPPLRERKADIPALAEYFVAECARFHDREAPTMSRAFVAELMRHDWPGNVRELQNHIEKTMVLTPGSVLKPIPEPRTIGRAYPPPREGRALRPALMVYEHQLIAEALARTGGNQVRAARELGISEAALRYKMKAHPPGEARKKPPSRKNLRDRRK